MATPEQVRFNLRPAGPTVRFLAWLLDLLVRLGVFLLLWMVLGWTGAAGFGVLLLTAFLLEWGYGFLFEWRWHGQTLGKKALGIRVLSADGSPAGPGACLLRNLLRVADWLPAGFLAGLTTMIFSGGYRRLGDLAAGTLVVLDERRVAARIPLIADPPILELARLLPLDLAEGMDAEQAGALADYAARRAQFSPRRREEMAAHLAAPLARFLGRPDLAEHGDRLLCALHLLRFHGRPTAEGGPPPAGQAADARLLEARRPGWRQLEALVERDAVQRGDQALALSASYRAACGDLALAEAHQLPAAVRGYLHDLVSRAHWRFYRGSRAGLRRAADLLLVEGPGRLWTDPCLRVALVAFYGSFFACSWLAAWQPELAASFAGDAYLAQVRSSFEAAPNDRTVDEALRMAGYYVRNNVGIALASFATGIFFGLGSVVTLLYNGVLIGLIFGWMNTQDDAVRAHFFEFTCAHGPFELTGIACAGAAGLRLGWGLVDCGGLTRAESLRAAATRAVPMLAAGATMVALAAPIEGFVSPSSLPLLVKMLIGVLCALAVVVYLGLLGWRGARILAARRDSAEAQL